MWPVCSLHSKAGAAGVADARLILTEIRAQGCAVTILIFIVISL